MPTNNKGPSAAKRAIEVLFCFEKLPTATIPEISAATGVPLPTAHRYVALLREMGLVEEISDNRYRLTLRVTSLAQAARSATPVVDIVDPFMRKLSAELNETVLFVQAVQGLPVCTHRVEAQRRLRLSFEVGHRMPALKGASAHLLLATRSQAERAEFVTELLRQGEEAPPAGIETFLEEVERDGKRGWASSFAEIEEGIWSTAAAVRSQGQVIGTLSIPSPEFRMNEEVKEHHRRAVLETAAEISAALHS